MHLHVLTLQPLGSKVRLYAIPFLPSKTLVHTHLSNKVCRTTRSPHLRRILIPFLYSQRQNRVTVRVVALLLNIKFPVDVEDHVANFIVILSLRLTRRRV